jgi:hypothetical protein
LWRSPFPTNLNKSVPVASLSPKPVDAVFVHVMQSDYSKVRGRVSKGELLQLVINHDQFAWLHRLSELIVQIDELIHSDEPVTSETIAALIADVQILLTPDEVGNDFAVKYDMALQHNPDVVLAHTDVVTLLATKDQL